MLFVCLFVCYKNNAALHLDASSMHAYNSHTWILTIHHTQYIHLWKYTYIDLQHPAETEKWIYKFHQNESCAISPPDRLQLCGIFHGNAMVISLCSMTVQCLSFLNFFYIAIVAIVSAEQWRPIVFRWFCQFWQPMVGNILWKEP